MRLSVPQVTLKLALLQRRFTYGNDVRDDATILGLRSSASLLIVLWPIVPRTQRFHSSNGGREDEFGASRPAIGVPSQILQRTFSMDGISFYTLGQKRTSSALRSTFQQKNPRIKSISDYIVCKE
jgi:hypothetical protein